MKCNRCGVEKTITEFTKTNRLKAGYGNPCKECKNIENRAAYKKNPEYKKEWQKSKRGLNTKMVRLYGITIEQYDKMNEKQCGKCLICGGTEPVKRLFVDHDHDTGAVRGLLCGKCNTALGLFGDNAKLLKSATEYLEVKHV